MTVAVKTFDIKWEFDMVWKDVQKYKMLAMRRIPKQVSVITYPTHIHRKSIQEYALVKRSNIIWFWQV
jgi:hypothetical protein